MEDDQINIGIIRARIEASLREQFEQTLNDRVSRILEVRTPQIVPNPIVPFAPVSAECYLLFRDAHYYGCVSLIQAVAEAIVRFMCEKNFNGSDKKFEKNVGKLTRRNLLTDEQKEYLMRIWDKRHDYHHLNQSIECDLIALSSLAKEKLLLLKNIEGSVFGYKIVDGKIRPMNPRYWDKNSGEVFLRIEP